MKTDKKNTKPQQESKKNQKTVKTAVRKLKTGIKGGSLSAAPIDDAFSW
ncbi:MAG TPA: hypothetical protein VFB81_24550 [Myxococcales bacterium]|nr:hypothetical protein [Myxococcales bacterium]